MMMPTSASAESRKASSAQIEAERNLLVSLIESNSERVNFTVCTAGRAPVWSLFRKVQLDNQITPFVVCRACGKLLKYTSRDGTKSMKSHMAKCSPAKEEATSALDVSVQGACGGGTPTLSHNRNYSVSNTPSFPLYSMSPQQAAFLNANALQMNNINQNEESSLDLSTLPTQSPSATLRALTPALSNIEESSISSVWNSTALQSVSSALESALQIFDTDIKDVDSELSTLASKLESLKHRRVELLKRRETVERAALAVGSQQHRNQSSPPEPVDQDLEPIPAKRSRRKPAASEVKRYIQELEDSQDCCSDLQVD